MFRHTRPTTVVSLVLVLLEHVTATPRTALAEVPASQPPAAPTSAGTAP